MDVVDDKTLYLSHKQNVLIIVVFVGHLYMYNQHKYHHLLENEYVHHQMSKMHHQVFLGAFDVFAEC
eukprot:UN05118